MFTSWELENLLLAFVAQRGAQIQQHTFDASCFEDRAAWLARSAELAVIAHWVRTWRNPTTGQNDEKERTLPAV